MKPTLLFQRPIETTLPISFIQGSPTSPYLTQPKYNSEWKHNSKVLIIPSCISQFYWLLSSFFMKHGISFVVIRCHWLPQDVSWVSLLVIIICNMEFSLVAISCNMEFHWLSSGISLILNFPSAHCF
jgi:hypothetical protein